VAYWVNLVHHSAQHTKLNAPKHNAQKIEAQPVGANAPFTQAKLTDNNAHTFKPQPPIATYAVKLSQTETKSQPTT